MALGNDARFKPDGCAVELIDLRKQFGAVVVVDGVSLRVAEGEFLTLLGPSGSGKTTTLRLIGGFELPTSGSISICGEAMGSRPPNKRPVNTVFQNYALFPHLTVAQNVAYGLRMAGVAKDERDRRVGNALEIVRLPGVERRKPSELSGGQQQRIALARALVNRPKVLLLDEPLGALDLKLRKAMQLELKALNREVGATFIYVTHDQEEALTMSDRIAVMSEGRILQADAPAMLYEAPRTRFVASFVGQTNFIDGRFAGRDGDYGIVDIPGAGSVRARLANGTRSLERVSVAIRPEKVAFASDMPARALPPEWNRLAGVVVEAAYLGAHNEYTLRLASGSAVTARRQNAAAPSPAIQLGAKAEIVFPPEYATILLD